MTKTAIPVVLVAIVALAPVVSARPGGSRADAGAALFPRQDGQMNATQCGNNLEACGTGCMPIGRRIWHHWALCLGSDPILPTLIRRGLLPEGLDFLFQSRLVPTRVDL